MINAIIKGITDSLQKEFENACEIVTEEGGGALGRPYFHVSCLGSMEALFRGKRYFRKNQFCIQYFPTEGEGKKEECNEIADRLFSCLEVITAVEEPVRGTDMKYEAVNDSVCFYVNYDMFLYKGCDTLPRMEELTEKISAKGR